MMRNSSTVEQRTLLLEMFVLSQLAGVVVDEIVSGSGITPNEFAVASSLQAAGQATPTELARQLGVPATTVSALVARLVEKGQLRRVPHPSDGRSYVLELTAKGRRTQQRNGERLVKAIRRLDGHLEGGSEAVSAALQQLESALRATIEDESPTGR
jgi:DNA-binding MarR family transcriptional regulator